MVIKTKKGKSGVVNHYMTRGNALKKLQLPLASFRKLCILKGVYPREPRHKKKLKGTDKTYFHTKDIIFLLHDPLLAKFRQYKVYKKKLTKAKAKLDQTAADKLVANKPQFSLDHLVRERYPSFVDALRDLDDALCMVHLFATLRQNYKIRQQNIEKCKRLCKEFQSFVVMTHALRKVFLSIKGIYYQAEIFGQKITWITPYSFTTKANRKDVDYKVMNTFLEFYETLLGFVNFKLYHSISLHYPPPLDLEKDAAGEFLRTLDLQQTEGVASTHTLKAYEVAKLQASVQQKLKDLPTENEEDPMDADEQTKDDTAQQDAPSQKDIDLIFKGCKFFLGREVPHESLEFVIKAFGGEVSWESSKAPYRESENTITHQVVDRSFVSHRFIGRDYVQPQWVYDSINAGVLLPIYDYVPNVTPPPHLSPFVDDAKEGYVPEYRDKLNALISAAKGQPIEALATAASDEDDEPEEEDEEEEDEDDADQDDAKDTSDADMPQVESDEEQLPPKSPKAKAQEKAKQKEQKKLIEEQEERKLKEIMMSRKHRRILSRHQYKAQAKKDRNEVLTKKRQLLEAQQTSKKPKV